MLQKGGTDRVSDGTHRLEMADAGMPRRCGGQGDLTAGLVTSLWTWAHLPHAEAAADSLPHSPAVLCAYTACYVTRQCAAAAFEKHGRSVLASHLIEELPGVIRKTYPL